MVRAPARRAVVQSMTDQGLTERHALRIVRMSASSLRYQPAPNRNIALRDSIKALAYRHKRYGAGMIYLKLRQRGLVVNHKRVERLYTEAGLQVQCQHRLNLSTFHRNKMSPVHRLVLSPFPGYVSASTLVSASVSLGLARPSSPALRFSFNR